MEDDVITIGSLVKVGHGFTDFNHMLRSADRKTVPLIMEYLHGQGMDVYLGGGVVRNWIFNGTRDYSDIDILAVARSEESRFELTRQLRLIADYSPEEDIADEPRTIDTYARDIKRGDRGVEVSSEGNKLVISGRKFEVQNSQPIFAYMNSSIESRFKMFPVKTLIDKVKLSQFSPIDLSFASMEKFTLNHQ